MKINKLMPDCKIAATESGKAFLGVTMVQEPIGMAIGKGIGDVFEYSAKKIDASRGAKDIEFNPFNILEGIEFVLTKIFKKDKNLIIKK